MNTPATLAIDEAHRRGVILTVTGPESLSFKAPLGAMTPDLVADLKAHKPEVIRILRSLAREDVAPVTLSARPFMAPTGRRHSRQSDPETMRLIRWFKESTPNLPQEPFRLAPWKLVTDPAKFLERLTFEADRYPNGDRPAGMSTDLLLLKAVVDECQSNNLKLFPTPNKRNGHDS